MMEASFIELAATSCFALAVIHTFLSSIFKKMASRYRNGSIGENFFHLLGEVEIVFGLWAGILLVIIAFKEGKSTSISYLEGRNFAEAIFVFAVLACAATKPILEFSERLLKMFARFLPMKKMASLYIVGLSMGPLLGSIITEPAAMTVTALLFKDLYFDKKVSFRFKYLTLAVLFVNISVGGLLTPYAAPPVLMVAEKWNLTLGYMLSVFGWKAVVICFINSILAFTVLRKEISRISDDSPMRHKKKSPFWIVVVHLLFLTALVLFHQHSALVIGMFLFLLGFVTVTIEHQSALKIRESLLVAFFLAGLVVLGGLQAWWLKPLIQDLDAFALFSGAAALTAITDNAALTYLGSQLPDVSEAFKYALLAGAVVGGGLTVIANAPNPAGFSILQDSFGDEGIRSEKLFIWALVPTLIAGTVFWIF